MARSVKKGPHCDKRLIEIVTKAKQKAAGNNSVPKVKTWSRSSTIIPEFVNVIIEVHNGKKFIPVFVTSDIIGHKLGEFSPTRIPAVHAANKKAALKSKGS